MDKSKLNLIVSQSWLSLFTLLSCYGYWLFYLHGDAGVAFWYLPEVYEELFDTHFYWQLLTPVFIHFDQWHLASNLFMWWYFGRIIGQVSYQWLVLLTLFCGIISNIIQWWYAGNLFGGMSGVVSAVIGFLAINQFMRPQGIFFINWFLVFIYFGYLLVVASGYFGVYSNAAHFAGLLGGILIGFCFVKWSRLQRDSTQVHVAE